jgi:hypothetical protein
LQELQGKFAKLPRISLPKSGIGNLLPEYMLRPLLLYTESFDRFFRFAGNAWFSPHDSWGPYDHKKIITQSRKPEKPVK